MKRPDRKDKKYWFKLGSVDQCRWGQYAIDLNDYIDHLESQLKEVKEENEKLKKKLEKRRTKRIVGRKSTWFNYD